MQTFKMLVLTDHSKHSTENSLYALVRAVEEHFRCEQLDVASRGLEENRAFFEASPDSPLFVSTANEHFRYHPDGLCMKKDLHTADLSSYDVVWFRLPPPLDKAFTNHLLQLMPQALLINDPRGVISSSSKAFLINFPKLCPPMQLCRTKEDILRFSKRFPIVLKPLNDYGGRGIVKIENGQAWEGSKVQALDDFLASVESSGSEYLGMKYLKNVTQGDKRIVVVNGEILGASLRLPAEGSWLCNVAMGGHSNYAQVTPEEQHIVAKINPVLSKMGIMMYGVDTLVNDDGKRMLSEINTTSIGGLPQMAKLNEEPLVELAADLIWDYIIKTITTQHAATNRGGHSRYPGAQYKRSA
jgi:glutathione synthase